MSRRALATAILIAAPLAVVAHTAAQEQPPSAPVTGTVDPPIDFVLRPSEDDMGEGESDDDIWNWQTEPGPSMLETPIGPPLAGPAPEEQPVAARKIQRTQAEDPFTQRGIKLGSFIIRPSIELGVTVTDNAGATANKTAAVGIVVAPEVTVSSKTDNSEFEAGLRGEGVWYDQSDFDTQTAEARAKYRYDMTSQTSIYSDASYTRFLEGFTDPDTPTAASERPAVDDLETSLGVEQRFGRLSTRLTAFAEREMHEDVTLAGGGTASRAELDNTQFGLRLRTGYATSASVRPFTEFAVGLRDFDQSHDDSGFARSSIWGELRGGLVIDRGDKLSGEVSVGYRHEDIRDDRLEDLNVLLANAAIVWSPRRLTEVKLDLSTTVNPTSTPGTSATVLYASTLTLARNLTPRLRAEGGVGLSYEDRIGDDWHDVTFTGFAGASYAFNRTASVEARYVYTHTDRNETGGEYDVNTVGLRLRLQR